MDQLFQFVFDSVGPGRKVGPESSEPTEFCPQQSKDILRFEPNDKTTTKDSDGNDRRRRRRRRRPNSIRDLETEATARAKPGSVVSPVTS